MSTKGKGFWRVYRCADCERRQIVRPRQLNSRFRLRCEGCGSAQMEPIAEDAIEERAFKNRVVVGQEETGLIESTELRFQKRARR